MKALCRERSPGTYICSSIVGRTETLWNNLKILFCQITRTLNRSSAKFYSSQQRGRVSTEREIDMPPPETDDGAVKSRIKDSSRDGRLSFKKFGEHQMRREFKELALEKCSGHLRAFGMCAEESGLMVVFNCRKFHKDLNACLGIHNSNEAFDAYKETHRDELEKRIIKS